MNLLITPSLKLNEDQKKILEKEHSLYYLEDERIPLLQYKNDIPIEQIDGIVCNFFFQHNPVDILPNLSFVQLTSVGLDRVPVEYLKRKGVEIYNAGKIYAIPMAEWVVGKILEIYKYSSFFSYFQRENQWHKNRDIKELYGAKAVLLGFGNVGQEIAKRLHSFGVEITAVDVVEDVTGLSDKWYHISDIKEAVASGDIIILCLPLTHSTYHIINDQILDVMKENSVLINVARGALIDEERLVFHLARGKFMGVALDVFEEEPLYVNHPFWSIERVIVTPHNSFVGNKNQSRLFGLLLDNLKRFGEEVQ